MSKQTMAIDRALESWDKLNQYLMSLEDPDQIREVMEVECRGKRRPTFMARIYSRFSRVRRDIEEKEWGLDCIP